MTAYVEGYKSAPSPNPRCGVWAEPGAYAGPLPSLVDTVRRSCRWRRVPYWPRWRYRE